MLLCMMTPRSVLIGCTWYWYLLGKKFKKLKVYIVQHYLGIIYYMYYDVCMYYMYAYLFINLFMLYVMYVIHSCTLVCMSCHVCMSCVYIHDV